MLVQSESVFSNVAHHASNFSTLTMTHLISYANTYLVQRSLRAVGLASSLAMISYGSSALAHEHDEKTHNQAQHAHVHGVVQLDVAADGKDLVLQLTAPQADITGFEHAANTAAEKQTVAEAINRLKLPSLFALNAKAACKLESVDIDGLEADSHSAHAKASVHSHETDTKAKDHGHPEHSSDAQQAADHGPEGDHDHDDAKHAHGHNDVSVTWQWHCDSIEQLDAIDVQLAKQFSSIHTINVQMAMPQGQASRTLTSGQTRLSWK